MFETGGNLQRITDNDYYNRTGFLFGHKLIPVLLSIRNNS